MMIYICFENVTGHSRRAYATSPGEKATNDSRSPHRWGSPISPAWGTQNALPMILIAKLSSIFCYFQKWKRKSWLRSKGNFVHNVISLFILNIRYRIWQKKKIKIANKNIKYPHCNMAGDVKWQEDNGDNKHISSI